MMTVMLFMLYRTMPVMPFMLYTMPVMPFILYDASAVIHVQEAGYSYVELNASDTRSKRSLQEEVMEALGNHTLVDFFGSLPRLCCLFGATL